MSERFGLCALNYQVTSNHVHLLVLDRGGDAIARSMQLIAGCVGAAGLQPRKRRRGAFWEDCYHATAVDTDEHLARCFTYIDLNMVRAGAVKHPCGWIDAGYHETQQPSARYRIIDREALGALLGVAEERLAALHNEGIAARLVAGSSAAVMSPAGHPRVRARR
jgi:putative transposase